MPTLLVQATKVSNILITHGHGVKTRHHHTHTHAAAHDHLRRSSPIRDPNHIPLEVSRSVRMEQTSLAILESRPLVGSSRKTTMG